MKLAKPARRPGKYRPLDRISKGCLSDELFPTSHRSTAESAIAVVGTLGGSAGLMLDSWIYGRVGNHWRAVSLLMLASGAAAITVAIFFPETASAELDSISPERSLLSPRHPSRRRRRPAAA